MSVYKITNAQEIPSPALIYYKEIIQANTRRALGIAGSPQRLWPHIKTHKMGAVLRMQMALGITRFKCATLAELELCAKVGAAHALLAYPLVGPNIERFLDVQARYPKTVFYAVGDDVRQLSLLSDAARKRGVTARVLADVNLGMNRTGVPLDHLEAFYAQCAGLEGLSLCGLHGYDGVHTANLQARIREALPPAERMLAVRERIKAAGQPCGIVILGGTPSFPVYASLSGVYLSPGTIFISDGGYCARYPELGVEPGAAVLARVVSHPTKDTFTIDVGYKAICSDCEGVRGTIADMPEAVPLAHSEEHWVFQTPSGHAPPPIGAVVYVIPTHICPTTALYPFAYVAERGTVRQQWTVDARNRI